MRNLWKHYYTVIDGIIFVIDSSKPERFSDVKDELQKMLANEDAKGVPCLIFANKQDCEGSVQPDEIIKMLDV